MNTEQFQIYMFHFRCPACAASPKPILLRDYLASWSEASPERLYSLLCLFAGALDEVVHGESRWITKKFNKAVGRVHEALAELPFNRPLRRRSHLLPCSDSLRFDTECPFCLTPSGPREPDNYFTDWSHACKVQTGNLLYETGLILWAILLALPAWSHGGFLQQLNKVRGEIRCAGKAMSFLECPQCGRLTSCLYGDPTPEENGFCRWCLDMGGGIGLAFRLDFDADGRPNISMMKTDHAAPARNSWDILPPEIVAKIDA